MENISREKIIDFLINKGYAINKKICSDFENGLYDCWFKVGSGIIKLRKGKDNFQESELSGIFYNRIILDEFKLFIK